MFVGPGKVVSGAGELAKIVAKWVPYGGLHMSAARSRIHAAGGCLVGRFQHDYPVHPAALAGALEKEAIEEGPQKDQGPEEGEGLGSKASEGWERTSVGYSDWYCQSKYAYISWVDRFQDIQRL